MTGIDVPMWAPDDPTAIRKAALTIIAQAGYKITPDLRGALEAIGALPYIPKART